MKQKIQRNLQEFVTRQLAAGVTLVTSDYHLIFSAWSQIATDPEASQILDELSQAPMKAIYHFMETGNLSDMALDKLAAVAELESLKIVLNDVVIQWQSKANQYPMTSEIRQLLFECAGDVLKIISNKA